MYQLIISSFVTVALGVGLYLLDKKTTLLSKMPEIAKQILIGVIFGASAILASEIGWVRQNVTVNVRDAAPLVAGLFFGWPSGLMAGAIGGGYRALSVLWGGETYTALACSISTALAGVTAAILRKFMFDDKKPTWTYCCSIAVVCEIFHMLMIFITNLSETHNAFEVIKLCTIPMVLANMLTVGAVGLILTILSKEKLHKTRGKEQIATTFQRWLMISIIIAYVFTSIFTYDLQGRLNKHEVHVTITGIVKDVQTDITDQSDTKLLGIAHSVQKTYSENKDDYVIGSETITDNLIALAETMKVAEINIIDKNGIIVASTNKDFIGFNMADGTQAKEFLVLLDGQTTEFVQRYQKMSFQDAYRKYAGISLEEGGFIQVGYNYNQFKTDIDTFIVDATKNRHIGERGFVVICDEDVMIVADNGDYNGINLSALGIEITDEMKELTIYKAKVGAKDAPNNKQNYLYAFGHTEGYYVIGAMPESEALFMRDTTIYISIFMLILIFATLFVMLFFLIKKLVIDNIHKINGTLSKISSGNLNEMVDVRSNVEFSSLSDDINSTVDTLKRYIAEAAARIDKELEYAKTIQLSALPNVFPPYPEQNRFDVYAQMIAAKEVGGDFYDFYMPSPNTVAFLVADVSGKGIPAAMFMMTAKTIIKSLTERGIPVNDIFTKANEKLCENNESGMFVTAWMGILDLTTGVLRYANAGHNPPVIMKDGKFEYLKSRAGFVLGGMEGVVYRINELQLNKGDRIFLYTDGVTEATNLAQELYGEERLLNYLNANKETKNRAMLIDLKSSIDKFVGKAPQFDDITMLIFDYYGDELGGGKEQEFDADVEKLSEVIEFLENELDNVDCPIKTKIAISVAIEEIFVNIAHYAYGEGKGKAKVRFMFDETERVATITLTDKGMPFNPLERQDPDVTLSAGDRDIGGLGIFITKKTMDDVIYRYQNDENILTLVKKL